VALGPEAKRLLRERPFRFRPRPPVTISLITYHETIIIIAYSLAKLAKIRRQQIQTREWCQASRKAPRAKFPELRVSAPVPGYEADVGGRCKNKGSLTNSEIRHTLTSFLLLS
jgi:hypothetical protein